MYLIQVGKKSKCQRITAGKRLPTSGSRSLTPFGRNLLQTCLTVL
jgi:hypothetical protein